MRDKTTRDKRETDEQTRDRRETTHKPTKRRQLVLLTPMMDILESRSISFVMHSDPKTVYRSAVPPTPHVWSGAWLPKSFGHSFDGSFMKHSKIGSLFQRGVGWCAW